MRPPPRRRRRRSGGPLGSGRTQPPGARTGSDGRSWSHPSAPARPCRSSSLLPAADRRSELLQVHIVILESNQVHLSPGGDELPPPPNVSSPVPANRPLHRSILHVEGEEVP